MSHSIAPSGLWWKDFGNQMGREQAGLRPAIVVGTALAGQLPNQRALVVPCTTTDRQLPFHPAITCLDRLTFAACDQLKSISRLRLVRPHPAQLPVAQTDAIKSVLRQLVDTR